MFRTVSVHLQEQLYKLYIVNGIRRYVRYICCYYYPRIHRAILPWTMLNYFLLLIRAAIRCVEVSGCRRCKNYFITEVQAGSRSYREMREIVSSAASRSLYTHIHIRHFPFRCFTTCCCCWWWWWCCCCGFCNIARPCLATEGVAIRNPLVLRQVTEPSRFPALVMMPLRRKCGQHTTKTLLRHQPTGHISRC
jgi:hypothetical protein